jgi:ubiquinone/menaquinone biosynthesis C-methylase UbiE
MGAAALPLRCGLQEGHMAKNVRSHAPHDWHSDAYVDDWIRHDVERNDERRPRLKRMVSLAPFPHDAAISVLDIGAGSGVVTEELLGVFPNARMTLQDFSDVMLGHARQRFSHIAGQIRYVLCDLTDPSWTDRVGGPFDLAVSAIAIHNLRDLAIIGECYRGICRVLEPGGRFLDYDRFEGAGGIAAHEKLLHAAGFSHVERAWEQSPVAILAAYGKSTA